MTAEMMSTGLEGDARILIVDDEAAVCRSIERILGRAGLGRVVVETEGRMVLRRHHAADFDAILLDLHMPEIDGFELMERLVDQIGEDDYAPIVVLTGDTRIQVRERALESGAKDFVQKPFEPTEVVARLRNIIETGRMHRRLTSFNEVLATRVEEQTADLLAAKLEVLERLARAGEYRDDMTGKHAQRVGTVAGLIAREMGLDEELAKNIEQAAPLHDIGKIGIPDGILLKDGALTGEELAKIRRHTIIGGSILSGSRFAILQTAERIALTHHEFWNGSGYPHGLAQEEIPVEGRITAVADAFDSLTNDRPYRRAASPDEAIEEILRWRARQFDPDAVDAICRLYNRGALAEIEQLTDRRRQKRAARESEKRRAGILVG